jgi:mono/diheme cytochrome c family protein
MTKTQIWTAAFVIAFALLFFLQELTRKEKPISKMPGTISSKVISKDENEGESLLKSSGCLTCHSVDLKGTYQGPGLYGLEKNYNREQLINYLRSPSSFIKSEHFKGYRVKYNDVIMPSFNNMDVKDLGKIADYLLSQK